MKRLQAWSNYFSTAYIMIIAVIYPLYIKNGFQDMASDKFCFWKYMTISGASIFGIFMVFKWLSGWRRRIYFLDPERISLTDLFFLFYGISLSFSYFLSDFKETGGWGTNEWFMGYYTQMLLVLCYFGISRLWTYYEGVWVFFLLSSSLVFIMGILNRFSIYPFAFQEVSSDFISTLGNINWYCGYWSVIWPIALCLFLMSREKVKTAGAGICLFLFTGAGVSQGSSSAFLSFGGVVYVLGVFSYYQLLHNSAGRWMKRMLAGGIIMCLACQAVRIGRILYPGRYNYDTDNLCGWVTGNSVTLYMGLALAGIVLAVHCLEKGYSIQALLKWKERHFLLLRFLWYAMLFIPLLCMGLYVLLCYLNMKAENGIPRIGSMGIFIFNNEWGSFRGATWKAGIELFDSIPFWGKIFGTGPDLFSEYAYSVPEISNMLEDAFPALRLTNAHNEMLTVLVNTGYAGAAAYGGLLLTVVYKGFKNAKSYPVLLIPAICVISYSVHNMVSFAQIFNTPILFLIIAIGESLYRKTKPERL